MTFLLNPFKAQHQLIRQSLTTSGHAGLKLSLSTFEGYSPMLDGSVHVSVMEDSLEAEKLGDINVEIEVKASSLSCMVGLSSVVAGKYIEWR